MSELKMTPYVPKESEVQSACLRYLNGVGIFAWRTNNGGTARQRGKKIFYTFNGIRGVSDITSICPFNKDGTKTENTGKILCIEMKRPGKLNTQSEDQKEFERMINKNNGIYILCDGWEMLDKKLKELKII